MSGHDHLNEAQFHKAPKGHHTNRETEVRTIAKGRGNVKKGSWKRKKKHG